MFKRFNSQRSAELPVKKTPPITTIITDCSADSQNKSPPQNSPRRHSLPEYVTDKKLLDKLTEQSLYTIQEVWFSSFNNNQ